MSGYARSDAISYLGSPSSPTTIAAGASATSSPIDLSGASIIVDFEMTATILIGSAAPTTSPTVQWQYSYDGTNWYPDGAAVVVPIDVVSTPYSYGYFSRPAARYARCAIKNGATNGISCYVQGATLGVS